MPGALGAVGLPEAVVYLRRFKAAVTLLRRGSFLLSDPSLFPAPLPGQKACPCRRFFRAMPLNLAKAYVHVDNFVGKRASRIRKGDRFVDIDGDFGQNQPIYAK